MSYSVYEQATGRILHTFTGPPEWLALNVPAGCSAIAGDYDSGRYKINLTTHVAELVPAAVFAAQWEKIRTIRDALRDAPVTLPDGWRVDATPFDVLQLQERLEQWGVGTATMTPDGRQMWKGADNDIRFFTQAEFAALVAAVRAARALKVDANFAYAEAGRAQLPLAEDHPIFDSANWPG